jgi:hypothetical protein
MKDRTLKFKAFVKKFQFAVLVNSQDILMACQLFSFGFCGVKLLSARFNTFDAPVQFLDVDIEFSVVDYKQVCYHDFDYQQDQIDDEQ